MGNPFNRPKHKQHRSWFKMVIDGEDRLIRPVNAEDWFNQPGFSVGLVHMVDENSDLVGYCEIGEFEKRALRVRSHDEP